MSSFSTVPPFLNLLTVRASDARFYRVSGQSQPCPCRTPEGFRDPEFHLTLKSYGIQSFEFMRPGPIDVPPLGYFNYTAVAVSPLGVPMYPALPYPFNVEIAEPTQITINFTWPERGDITAYWIFRAETPASAVQIASVLKPQEDYIDSTPLGASGPRLSENSPVLCNEEGSLPMGAVDIPVKAFIQPIQSTRATRLTTEYLLEMFGNIEADDHLGIFPITWGDTYLEFNDWSQSGDDFIEYDSSRYFVVNANKIPDPGDGNPNHHWEVGLRLISDDGLVG